MGILDSVRKVFSGGSAGAAPSGPSAQFFQGNRNPLLASWRPMLRETRHDIAESWGDAAARSVEGVQNSGFLTRVVEVETGSVVGAGLRFASRPDFEALGWTPEESSKFSRAFERGFQSWCNNPVECDAGGKMTFGKMQQAAYLCYKAFGEILALTPVIDRAGAITKTKVKLLPPTRLDVGSNDIDNIHQGVKVDDWGFPIAYKIKRWDKVLGWSDFELIQARDRDGRPNVLHVFDGGISQTRGISPLAPVLKVVRQADQYSDATLTTALIQTIFAATIETSMQGINAFDGLMTGGDTGGLDIAKLASAQADWYDAAQINLTQHGRIAHLFPGEKLNFTESKASGSNYDHFMSWMLREICAGSGVTYEAGTGDFRGATYSSIRMGGAIEWLGVTRKRNNIIVPFCDAVKNLYLDEAIFTGRLKLPKGGTYLTYLAQRDAISRGKWAGPAQPQADDFKAARSHQVLMDIGGTTLQAVAESYGNDWEDDARQKAEENRLHEELGLPLPHAPKTLMDTKEGQKAEIEAASNPPEQPAKAPADASAEKTVPAAQEPDPADIEIEEDLNLGD